MTKPMTDEELAGLRARIAEKPSWRAVTMLAEIDRLRALDKLAREWLKAEEAWLASDDGTKEDIELSKASVAARHVYRAAVEGAK